jgi:hypothetical protein
MGLMTDLSGTKLLACYGIARFICVPTIHSTSSPPVSLKSILILSSYLPLYCPIDLFTSSFPTTILYTFLLPHMHVTYRFYFILFNSVMLINYMVKSINYEVPHNIRSISVYHVHCWQTHLSLRLLPL